MILTCPQCKLRYEFIEKIKVCNSEVGRNRARDIKIFWKRRNQKRIMMFNEIKSFYDIKWKNEYTYSTQDILKELELYGQTKGDLLRIILDNFVCLGLLSKKYQRGRRGHLYTKNWFVKECKYYNSDKQQCNGFYNDKEKFVTDKIFDDIFTKILLKNPSEQEDDTNSTPEKGI